MLAMPVAQALERSRLFEAAARHREQAEWTSATLDAMFAGAPVGLALLDREMRFLRMNAVLAGMNGIPPEAHLGKTPLDLMPGPLGAQLAAAFRRVIETGAPVEDVVMVGETPARPGETQRRTESWFPVRVGGAIVGVGVLVREQPAGDARAARAGTDGPGR
jgi:PAS domain-containing protein